MGVRLLRRHADSLLWRKARLCYSDWAIEDLDRHPSYRSSPNDARLSFQRELRHRRVVINLPGECRFDFAGSALSSLAMSSSLSLERGSESREWAFPLLREKQGLPG